MGQDGPLKAWANFEIRPEQTEMALEVERAMKDDDLTIIEAGTGTGKTLAYLLPALLSGKTTVVSTGLKNLQDQIYQKDIVFLKKYFEMDFQVAVIKGRENYVCRRLLRLKARNPSLLMEDQRWKDQLNHWASDSLTGLLEDIPKELQDKIPKTVKIYSSSDSCRGSSCPNFHSCFYYRNIALAAKSKIILVNHYIFVLDLSLKAKTGDQGGIIPDWEAVILDEAHLLEKTATECLGYVFEVSESAKTIEGLIELFEKGIMKDSPMAEAIIELCQEIIDILDSISSFYKESFSERELYTYETPREKENSREIAQKLRAVSDRCEALSRTLPSPKLNPAPASSSPWGSLQNSDYGKFSSGQPPQAGPFQEAVTWEELVDQPDEERLDLFQKKLATIIQNTSFIADHSDETFVYQVSAKFGAYEPKSGKKSKKEAPLKISFAALPIEAGQILGDMLRRIEKTTVLTSATLSTSGNFNFFKNRFGFSQETPSLTLDSPFDYAANTVLYLPAHIPGVDDSHYPEAFLRETAQLLNLSKGRGLVLFTSNEKLKMAAAGLPDLVAWPVMVQNDDTKANLLERFKNNVNSILMATASFWQGIDVPGESLSVVIIDRLPFEHPFRPLAKGRKRLLEQRGQNAFNSYALPHMLLTLRQGLGRLLRSSSDRGVLAIFDKRAAHSSYAKDIQKSLPPSLKVDKLSDLEEFLASI
ncbi:MAG: ATP-dependent DNA helicase [Deltaproteobacteria bacterium]|nr:ATP-dependent DNA helicase [Deltaproteobacteria bacterium]